LRVTKRPKRLRINASKAKRRHAPKLFPSLRGPERIVFSSSRGNITREPEIYIMRPDGTQQRRLTNNTARDHSPALSPDRRRIVFVSNRDNPATGRLDIYSMNTDGGDVQRLTNEPFLGSEMPAWSGDGERIVFMRGTHIWTMNADGSEARQITEGIGLHQHPAWSSDGRYIAFCSTRDATPEHPWNWEIYLLDVSTPVITHVRADILRRLTFNTHTDEYPRWSPDGRKIAFVSDRDSTGTTRNDEIYVMNNDGSDQQRVTSDAAWDWYPAWSPNGRKILFSRRDSLWTIRPDGNEERRLTDPSTPDFPSDTMPHWR
jgi:Tol biopolymer transport system component